MPLRWAKLYPPHITTSSRCRSRQRGPLSIAHPSSPMFVCCCIASDAHCRPAAAAAEQQQTASWPRRVGWASARAHGTRAPLVASFALPAPAWLLLFRAPSAAGPGNSSGGAFAHFLSLAVSCELRFGFWLSCRVAVRAPSQVLSTCRLVIFGLAEPRETPCGTTMHSVSCLSSGNSSVADLSCAPCPGPFFSGRVGVFIAPGSCRRRLPVMTTTMATESNETPVKSPALSTETAVDPCSLTGASDGSSQSNVPDKKETLIGIVCPHYHRGAMGK